ncbi:hypothetical protein L1887_55333 [Cichorium endivia]|nr:hypothetical protein L1887_55333 [Cichorium endivia]
MTSSKPALSPASVFSAHTAATPAAKRAEQSVAPSWLQAKAKPAPASQAPTANQALNPAYRASQVAGTPLWLISVLLTTPTPHQDSQLFVPPNYRGSMSQSEATASVPLGPFTVYDRKAGVYASRLPSPTIPAESVFEYCLGNIRPAQAQGTALRTRPGHQGQAEARRHGAGGAALLGRGGVLSIDELLAPEAEARAAKPYVPEDLNTTAYLPASSGTTGLPKAVQISHRNLVAMLAMNFNTPGFIPGSLGGEQLRMLSFLPFFHAYGLVGQLHLILRQRGQLFIPATVHAPVAVCRGAAARHQSAQLRAAGADQAHQVSRHHPRGVCECQARTLRCGTVGCRDRGQVLAHDRRRSQAGLGHDRAHPRRLGSIQWPTDSRFGRVSDPLDTGQAVVGRYDKEAATELPCAFVELSPSVSGKDVKEVVAQIDAFVRSKVSHHKFLRGGIHVVDKVPVSASGKILRKQVRLMLQELEAAQSTPQKAKL